MILDVKHGEWEYQIDTKHFVDISIPYDFKGPQPNFFNVKPGNIKPLQASGKSWSVEDGAGCNVPEVSLNIHCTGTHTECVGHLLEKPSNVPTCLENSLMPAVLVTVEPKKFASCDDPYHCEVNPDELVITVDNFFRRYKEWFGCDADVLILRTTPNTPRKQFMDYGNNPAPFLTNDAMSMICDTGIKHLIVDLPSLDRFEDACVLGNHRMFWGDGLNPHCEINANSTKTITELAYIPNELEEGLCFVSIQLPHFLCDAAPSRPLVFPVI